MMAPRIEIDLCKIRQNTRFLVDRLAAHGIRVAGVTKAVCGDPVVAQAMLDGGASELADARLSNIIYMRGAGITCPIAAIRTPMLSEVGGVVDECSSSYNTEIDVIAALSAAALLNGAVHNIILMVEMGDMRDGIMPEDVAHIASIVTEMPGVALKGIGANFACLGSVAPDPAAMAVFSELANEIEGACGPLIETVSGGGSANLPWALGLVPKGRINELRIGEAILLGTDPVSGAPIDGLHTDAFILVVEVIEAKLKTRPVPLRPVDKSRVPLRLVQENLCNSRAVIAVGFQDTDVCGLTFPLEATFIGATSDHAVLETAKSTFRVGDEIRCEMNYSALMRAMNARDVGRIYVRENVLDSLIA